MQINVNFDQAIASLPTGFVTAVNWVVSYLDTLFTNPVTLNIDVGYGEIAGSSLPAGALGASQAPYVPANYNTVKSALLAENAPGASTLPPTSPVSGSLYVPQAEAKALGISSSPALDGYVGFSNSVQWSYTPNVTPSAGAYYLVGTLEHEITELMGRVSLVDSQPNFYAAADLYRYTATGARSLTTGGTGSLAYFSVDGGHTLLRSWNNNPNNGDVGDWYGSGASGPDMANDYSSSGVINGFSSVDLIEMQALGWTIASVLAAPTITSFSTDTGVVGDHITSASVLTLSGTAVANSTVNVYDGATLLGTAAANASGAWTYTTGTLASGAHSFTATATASGSTSAASAALSVTVDTHVPAAPVITAVSPDTGVAGDAITAANILTLAGLAEANSTVTVYDGATLLGTTAANGSGAWTYITKALADGLQIFTATATDVAGTTSASSSLIGVVVDTTPPAAPIITTDTTVNNSTTLGGTAEANSTVRVYDGTTLLNSVLANNSGIWSYTTGPLAGSTHVFTARATDVAGNMSVSSQVANPTSGTPVVIELHGATSLVELGNHIYLEDSSGAGPSLKYLGADVTAGQFGAWAPIGAEQTSTGYEVAWKMTGLDQYTVWSADAQGNRITNLIGAVSGSSAALQYFESGFHQDLNGDGTMVIELVNPTSLVEVGNNFYLEDSSGAGPSLKYFGANVTDAQFGAWAPIGAMQTTTGYQVAWKMTGSDQYTVWSTDNQGNRITNLVGAVSGSSSALQSFETSFLQDLNNDGHIGSSLVVNGAPGGGTIASTAVNEVLFGNGGSNTFVFSGITWGTDIVADFHPNTDIVQLSQTAFANLAAVLSHAAQVSTDVVITADATDTVTLKNTVLSQLTSNNIHIV